MARGGFLVEFHSRKEFVRARALRRRDRQSDGCQQVDLAAGHTTHPVATKLPNPWGLYDMHGYLWEFVADAWHADYKRAPADSKAWDGDKKFVSRVIRSGSWRDRYPSLRSATRLPLPDHVKSDAIGLRCVKAAVLDGAKKKASK